MKKDVVSLCLYYDKDAHYIEPLRNIRDQCSELEKEGKARLWEFESRDLSTSERKKIEDKIRSLIPQQRGSIVATRGFSLPLSNSKKLNIHNTPILLVISDDKLVYVFPCLVGEKYYGAVDGVDWLKESLPNLSQLPGITEAEITEQLLENIPEPGLILEGKEVDTSAGLADLVFVDLEGRHIIVEVEREATDSSLGQVLRLASAYERKFALTRDRVRTAIACIRMHEFVNLAAKRASVEVWLLPTE